MCVRVCVCVCVCVRTCVCVCACCCVPNVHVLVCSCVQWLHRSVRCVPTAKWQVAMWAGFIRRRPHLEPAALSCPRESSAHPASTGPITVVLAIFTRHTPRASYHSSYYFLPQVRQKVADVSRQLMAQWQAAKAKTAAAADTAGATAASGAGAEAGAGVGVGAGAQAKPGGGGAVQAFVEVGGGISSSSFMASLLEGRRGAAKEEERLTDLQVGACVCLRVCVCVCVFACVYGYSTTVSPICAGQQPRLSRIPVNASPFMGGKPPLHADRGPVPDVPAGGLRDHRRHHLLHSLLSGHTPRGTGAAAGRGGRTLCPAGGGGAAAAGAAAAGGR